MLLIVLIWDILSIISDISEKIIVLYPNNSLSFVSVGIYVML